MFFIGRTDTRSTQNYSSEPHKNMKKKRKKNFLSKKEKKKNLKK